MPRFGSGYKMYDMILPNLELDVSHMVENVLCECTMCNSDVALYECKKCYQKGLLGDGPGIASYCKECNGKVHSNPRRADHKPRRILIPRLYRQYCIEKETTRDDMNEMRRLDIDKHKMELFAVVSETSHYVAFVKCGVGADAPWCFFDSMADRNGERSFGERNGYNIPAVTICPEALEWLSKDTKEILAAKERGDIPEKVRRLLSDGYLCMYQNLDKIMFEDGMIGGAVSSRNGKQLFDGNPQETTTNTALVYRGKDPKGNLQGQLRAVEQQLTNVQEQLRRKEMQEVNLHEQLREKEQQEENVHRELREMEQELIRRDEHDETVQRQVGDMEQQLTNVQEQLRRKEMQEVDLYEQLREKEQQEEMSQKQLREIEQQLRERDEHEEISQRQLRELQRQLARMEGQLREKDRELENSERLSREREEQQLTNFQRQLHEKELQEASLHEQLREKNQQEENSQRQLREMEQQLTNSQEQLRRKEDESGNLQQHVTTLEGQLRTKDQEMNELEITLSTAQQALTEQQRQQSPDWVISRDQIQLTDKLLGRGGWGSVVEGKYCGCAVAVKQIHELILSAHNRNLFEREMDIASKCRHPCLLQFIGATNDEGSPLFVTELMESSLRALLEQRPLTATEVSVISLDVARALSYLHQKTPTPIIHRDISSANVLLWRQGDQWRGKVSDYGTANFMQHTMTVAPGAMIYSAPEALTSNQTVKVDVYSFGVLLCEMCIQQLPDPERRDQQIAMVTNRLLRALVRRCVQTEPGTRPSMEEIIEELEQLV